MPTKPPDRATKVYARVVGGSRQAYCPDCGYLIVQKVPVTQHVTVIICRHCDARFYWGVTLYRPPMGVCVPPEDVLVPQFADVYPSRIASGTPINSLRQLSEDGLSWTPIDHTTK